MKRLTTINKNARHEDAINRGGTIAIIGLAVPIFYHFGKAVKSRRKAVDYLNLRQ